MSYNYLDYARDAMNEISKELQGETLQLESMAKVTQTCALVAIAERLEAIAKELKDLNNYLGMKGESHV